MPSKTFLGRTGRTTEYIHHDAERPNDLIIEEVEDVRPLVEKAKIVADQAPSRELRHVAFIPDFVLNKAFREGWFNDPKAWKKWVNDPDNKAFRTWNGKV